MIGSYAKNQFPPTIGHDRDARRFTINESKAMPYPLPENVRELRDTVRRFVDEVAIPRELEAKMDPEAARAHRAGNMDWAKRNGLWAMTLPADQGGGGRGFLEQAVVNEQAGRATNGVGWCFSSPPRFLAEVATPH